MPDNPLADLAAEMADIRIDPPQEENPLRALAEEVANVSVPSLEEQANDHRQQMRDGLHGPALQKRLELETAADAKVYKMKRGQELTDEMAYKYRKMTPGARLLASGMAQVFPALQAGVERVLGDSDAADEAIRQGQAIEAGSAQVDPSFASGVVRGATRSLGLAGVTAPLGGYGAAAAQGAIAGNEALTAAEDAGKTGWDRLGYAGRAAIIEGGVTSLFNKMGMSGVEGKVFTKELFKNLGKNFLNEAREEVAIELLNAVNEATSNVDANATDPVELAVRVGKTLAQTGLVVGGAKGVSKIANMGEAPEPNPESITKAVGWAKTNPDAATALIKTGKLSRKDAAAIGVERSSATEREAMLTGIERSMTSESVDQADIPATELPEAPVAQEAPKESAQFDLRAEIKQRMDGKEPRGAALNPKLLDGKESHQKATEAAVEYVKNNPNSDAVFVGLDVNNQKGVNDFFGDNNKADKEALTKWADVLEEELSKVGQPVMFKQGGDEWGAILVAPDGKIDEQAVSAALDRVNERVREIGAKSGMPIDLENPRARKPKYKPAADDAEGQKFYEQEMQEYLRARGFGFRVGIERVSSGDTYDSLMAEISKQHDAAKKGSTNEQSIEPSKTRSVAPEGQAGRVAAGTAEARSRAPEGSGGSLEDADLEQTGQQAEALESLPMREVLARAKSLGLKGYAGLKKSKIIERIRANTAPDSVGQPTPDGQVLSDKSERDAGATQVPEKTDVASKLKSEADESPQAESLGSLGGNMLAGRQPLRDDVVPEAAHAPTPDIEQRLNDARGVKPEGLADRIKTVAEAAWQKSTRAQEFVPNDKRFAGANEFFRLLKEVPKIASDETVRTVAAVIDPLGPKQKAIFERYLLAKNLHESVQRGEPLRFGFKSIDEVKVYVDKLQAVVDQTPEIKKAVEGRTKVVAEFVKELQDHNILPKGLNREWYYHQQVLERLAAESFGGSKAKRQKRTFQRERIQGEALSAEYDYNTDFIEAEATWMTEARIELMKEKKLRELNKLYGKTVKAGGRIPDGYEAWSPAPGNIFHRATSIPEKVAEEVQREILADSPSDPAPTGAVYFLPTEIAKQLKSMEKAKATGVVAQLAQAANATWKLVMVAAPWKITGYTLRNITGDVDATVAGAPGVLKYVDGGLLKEIHDYYSGKKLALSDDMKLARDNAVLSASMEVQEIPDLKDLPVFNRFYQDRSPGLVKGYFDTVKKYQSFREGVLRYAAFKYFKDKLKTGGLENYGGSKKEVVDALVKDMGLDVAAANLSRNLLGDYGNLVHAGNWLRSNLIPFWSYMEINAKRYRHMIPNALKGKGGTARTAVLGTTALMRLGAMYALWSAYNNLWRRDEEEDLNEFDRANPHINLGRYADGSVRVLRNVGALGDLMEWFGLNTLFSLAPQVKAGQMSAGDVAGEMINDPFQKLFHGLRPDMKLPFELYAGQSFFPDPSNPRTKDRGEIVAGLFGLEDLAKEVQGRTAGDGSRARPHAIDRMFFGVSDPRKNAISEMYDLREKFLKKEGKEVPPFRGGASSFGTMKNAAMNDDRAAFNEARQAYLKQGKGYDNFKAALKFIDPVAGKLNDADEAKFETEFLTQLQRGRLKIAREFAKETEIKLWKWWQDAAASDPEDVKSAMEGSLAKELRAKAILLSRPMPSEPQKRAEHLAEVAEIKAWMKEREVPAHKVRAALWDYVRKEFKDQSTRIGYLERLSTRLK